MPLQVMIPCDDSLIYGLHQLIHFPSGVTCNVSTLIKHNLTKYTESYLEFLCDQY